MKIMCMGDSITHGNGLTDLSCRWSDLTAAATGHTMVNLGIGGDATGGMLARCQTQVFAKDPDALLLLGDNSGMALVKTQIFEGLVGQVMEGLTK